MFDRLITVNYRRGGGGEFFASLLNSTFTQMPFEQNTDFGTENRFEFIGIDLIWKTKLHHYFWSVFLYDDIESYVKGELGFPHGRGLPMRKRWSSNKVATIVETYNMMIKGTDKGDEIQNLKDYCVTCKDIYDRYFEENGVRFGVANMHYDNCNKYGMKVGDFLTNSKNINLINNNVDEYFYTLLWVYKRLPDLKYYPYKMKSAYAMPKEDMLEYYKFQSKKPYGSFPGELGVEVFDLHYRDLRIDDELSELIGTRVRLDYDRIKAYSARNRELMIQYFNVDVFKDYSEEQIYAKFEDYLHKIYDEI